MIILARILLVLALLVPSIANAQFTDQRTWAPTTGGTANAQTVAIANVSGPPQGVQFRAKASAINTGAMTLNVNSTGAKNVTKPSPAGPVPLTGGELQIGQIFEFMYDGTNYQITSNLNATAAGINPTPQVYLTPCKYTSPVSGCVAGNLVPTTNVVAATVLYAQPVGGNLVPIWNGSQFVSTAVTETQMTLTLGSSNLANTAYDVCVAVQGGVPVIMTGPAWTTSTTGAGARGTGAGTPELTKLNGVYVNAVSISGRNGGSTYTIPANQCTVIASILIDGTNGQVSFYRNGGQNQKWAAFNFYNRLPIKLKAWDPTASWTYATNTFRISNNNPANGILAFTGLPEEQVTAEFTQDSSDPNTNGQPTLGIGYNSGTVASGKIYSIQTPGNGTIETLGPAKFVSSSPLGLQTIYPLERAVFINNHTWYGTETNMLLTVEYRG